MAGQRAAPDVDVPAAGGGDVDQRPPPVTLARLLSSPSIVRTSVTWPFSSLARASLGRKSVTPPTGENRPYCSRTHRSCEPPSPATWVSCRSVSAMTSSTSLPVWMSSMSSVTSSSASSDTGVCRARWSRSRRAASSRPRSAETVLV
ncbi:hypothetical protein ACFQ0M_10145 [Kitasatospora aburaviensis]